MTNSKGSATRSKSNKPAKPYDGFPLFAHNSGRWAKKIRGKVHYFGSWKTDPEGTAALERFNREWPYIKDGRTPPPVETGDALTIALLADEFLNVKRQALDAGELSEQTFADYFRTCRLLVDHLGRDRRVDDLRPDDFAKLRKDMSDGWGPVRLRNEINRMRVVFKFAHDQRLIDRPVHFGQSFGRPSAKSIRKARNEAGPRLFEADEVQRILDVADPVMRAMTLLGLNCGFGNTDVASLPQSAVDLENGWIDFPRPKTEIPRHVPLWPETAEALREAINRRPKPKDPANVDLCFVTVQGNPWVRIVPKRGDQTGSQFVKRDTVTSRFGGLLKQLGINGRKGLGFYTLRHNFQTIGGEAKDPEAVSAIMGHVDQTMAGQYRERISDERLRAVVETVRAWLWPANAE